MGTRTIKLTLLAWFCLGAKALAEDNRDTDAVLVLEGGVHAELSGEGAVQVRGGLVIRDGASLVVRDGASLIIRYAPRAAVPAAAVPPAEISADIAADAPAQEPTNEPAAAPPVAPVILTVPDDPPPAAVSQGTVNQIEVVVEHRTNLPPLTVDRSAEPYVDES